MEDKRTCEWPGDDSLMNTYHDEEWGVPVHNDRKLFEFIVLDGFQAGLSWRTILHKRENFKVAFDNFDYQKIALYGEKDVTRLMNNPGIIRNQSKIRGTITNARCFCIVQKEFGTFDQYIWQFTGGKTIINNLKSLSAMLVKSKESDVMSIDLKKRGFKFVGSTICYAFMQAAGLVNDHLVQCYRYDELKKLY